MLIHIALFLMTVTPHIQSQFIHRLPTNVHPNNYKLMLALGDDEITGKINTFTGMLDISLQVNQITQEIKLHSSSTTKITSVTLKSVGDDANLAGTFKFDESTEILTISSQKILEVGQYTLNIMYEGTINQISMHGLYRSSYTDENNSTVFYLATQFAPTFARRVFPCFDEPLFKATFDFTFFKYPNYVSILFNTNPITTTGSTIFQTTPLMSTYSLGFVISRFNCTTAVSVMGVGKRICSTTETVQYRSWGVDVASRLLDTFNTYTGVLLDNSLSKMDHLALPNTIGEAVENWGLINYAEENLLYNPEESTNLDKQHITTWISREIAQQWFGNLVTVNWWSDLFLNKGIAEYLAYFCTHRIFPTWQMNEHFIIDTVQSALRNDEDNPKVLKQDVSTSNDILLWFNNVNAKKGGSLIQMVKQIVGEIQFRQGVENYLSTYNTEVPVPENFWNTLQNSADIYSNLPSTLHTIMESWVNQPGFPLLTVIYSNGNVNISQKPFISTDTVSNWYVPITYTTPENLIETTTPISWLIPGEKLVMNINTNANWILLNNFQTSGIYRVNYDPQTWNSISAALQAENFSGIHEIDRSKIVDDLFSLAKIGEIDYITMFGLLDFLKNDSSYFSWQPAFIGFNNLLERVGVESDLYQLISEHIITNMETLYSLTSFDIINEEDHVNTLKQNLVLRWACFLGVEDCINKSLTMFTDYKNGGERPHKNIREIVYCTAMRETLEDTDWYFLWDEYETSNVIQHKSIILSTLTCTKKRILLRELLQVSLEDYIRPRDKLTLFKKVVENPRGIEIALDFVGNNLNTILEKYQGSNVGSDIFHCLARKVTNDTLAMFENIINQPLLADYQNEGVTALKIARNNIEWLQNHEEELKTYYESNLSPFNSATNLGSFIFLVIFLWIAPIVL